MARNKYDEGLGVARLRWVNGDPTARTHGTVLVEVWAATVSLYEGFKPLSEIEASVELRRFRNNEWQTLSHAGDWVTSGSGAIRRHAYFASRSWRATITLDGWDSE